MERKKKFLIRQFGLWLGVVGINAFFNLLLAPADLINDGMYDAFTIGGLGGTMFAIIADKIDLHYEKKEA